MTTMTETTTEPETLADIFHRTNTKRQLAERAATDHLLVEALYVTISDLGVENDLAELMREIYEADPQDAALLLAIPFLVGVPADEFFADDDTDTDE